MESRQRARQAFLAVVLSMGFIYTSVFSEIFASESLKVVVPEHFCLVMSSNTLPSAWLELVQGVLSDRFHLNCDTREAPVLEPFAEVRRLATDEKVHFIFWADKDAKADEIVIRAFDPASKLQWGILRSRIEGLSSSAARTVLDDALTQLMLHFPAVGVLMGGEVVLWSSLDPLKTQVAERETVDRHPFLPQILKFKYLLKPDSSVQLSRNSLGDWVAKGEGKKLKNIVASGKAYWLVVDAK
jgi:hypothetical protein